MRQDNIIEIDPIVITSAFHGVIKGLGTKLNFQISNDKEIDKLLNTTINVLFSKVMSELPTFHNQPDKIEKWVEEVTKTTKEFFDSNEQIFFYITFLELVLYALSMAFSKSYLDKNLTGVSNLRFFIKDIKYLEKWLESKRQEKAKSLSLLQEISSLAQTLEKKAKHSADEMVLFVDKVNSRLGLWVYIKGYQKKNKSKKNWSDLLMQDQNFKNLAEGMNTKNIVEIIDNNLKKKSAKNQKAKNQRLLACTHAAKDLELNYKPLFLLKLYEQITSGKMFVLNKYHFSKAQTQGLKLEKQFSKLLKQSLTKSK